MGITIATRDDLSTWLDNTGVAADLSTGERSAVLDRLTTGSPRWGADWADYLGSIDLVALADAVVAEIRAE